MTLRFNYSAPGKLILFGEHAVVYGYAGLSTAISKRMTMKCELFKSTRSEVNILDDGERTVFNPFIECSPDTGKRDKMLHSVFAQYLPKNHTLNMEINTGFSTTGGLGSSGSFCSLIAAAAIRSSGQSASKERILQMAIDLEKVFHSKSSGLDPTTIVMGGAIRMENGKFTKLQIPNLPLLIVSTNVKHSTADAVSHVRDLATAHPKIYTPLLSSLGGITDLFCNTPNDKKGEALYNLFPVAQHILATFDLECPECKDICTIAHNNGLTAKISGAGMGGITLVTGPNVKDKAHLFKKYPIINTEIGCEGLREE